MRSDTVVATASDATPIAYGRRARGHNAQRPMTTPRTKVWYSDALLVFACCNLLFHSTLPIAAVVVLRVLLIIVKKCIIESVLDGCLEQSRTMS